jgi:hypothetical protein
LSLLSLSWCCHPCCNGVAIVDAQASLQSRYLCRCQDSVVALIALATLPSSSHQAGVVALITMALLPSSMHMHLHHCHGGVVALITPAPLPTLALLSSLH